MSSSDSSGVGTWGPQNGGYNLDSMSDASDWSPSPRPSSSRSPAFEQQRYGPSSRQPYGCGNQHGGSIGRPKSGSTSRSPDYRDGHPAVERELFRKTGPSSSSVGSPTSVLENAGVPISAPPKTRSKPWSRRPWSSVKGAPTSAPESAGVPTSTPTWRSVHRKSTQPQSQPVKLGDRHPTNRDGGVEGLGRGDGSVGEECSSGDPDPEVGAGESARASPSPGEDVQDEVRYGRSEEEGGSRGELQDAEKDRHDQRGDQPIQWDADAWQWQPSLETVIIKNSVCWNTCGQVQSCQTCRGESPVLSGSTNRVYMWVLKPMYIWGRSAPGTRTRTCTVQCTVPG